VILFVWLCGLRGLRHGWIPHSLPRWRPVIPAQDLLPSDDQASRHRPRSVGLVFPACPCPQVKLPWVGIPARILPAPLLLSSGRCVGGGPGGFLDVIQWLAELVPVC